MRRRTSAIPSIRACGPCSPSPRMAKPSTCIRAMIPSSRSAWCPRCSGRRRRPTRSAGISTSAGTYDFVTMREVTPGRANAYPRVGPVVINEIMYHPATDADAEYIELLNISGVPVTLFDFVTMEPWRLSDDSGVDFRFPTDVPVTLEAGAASSAGQRLEHAGAVSDPRRRTEIRLGLRQARQPGGESRALQTGRRGSGRDTLLDRGRSRQLQRRLARRGIPPRGRSVAGGGGWKRPVTEPACSRPDTAPTRITGRPRSLRRGR